MKSIPTLYIDKANCCGCSACYSSCPVAAISMQPDKEGFLYPIIDSQKCIGCNTCLTVCAFKEHQKEKRLFWGCK